MPSVTRIGTSLLFEQNCRYCPEVSSLTYIKVDDVTNQAAQMGKGTLTAKMDVEEAYRIILIHPPRKTRQVEGPTHL